MRQVLGAGILDGQRVRGLADKLDDQQAALRYVLPELARLLVRRGAPDAEAVLGRAVELAGRTVGRHVLLPAVLAQLERSWLTGRTEESRVVAGELLDRCERSGRERERGELLRWLARCGTAAAPFDGCPEEFAAGLRGDWRTAAAAWERRGAHYERALELLDSGQIDPTLEALAVLDELGALPAARIARQRLRALGVRQIPRGPRPASRANPAGLTGRQVEILRLLADGLTNAEIAARLVVSVRTVDHHVSAVLQKLGVAGRREAAAASAELGLMGNAEA